MGNPFALIFESIFPTLVEHAKYIFALKDNLKALINAILELEASSADVVREVEIQERQGLQRLEIVGLWINRVEVIGPKVLLLLEGSRVELRRLSMFGYWSDDFESTYRYGEKVSETLDEVKTLLSTKPPDETVARRGLPPHMEGLTQHPVGLENILEETWERLMKDKVGILGLYGMGGIGKTTILEQIKNKFLEKGDEFDEVISVVVSQDVQIDRIQKEIGKRLGLFVSDTEWELKTQKEKAELIRMFLARKRFVMLLDDIWKKVELEKIGIPLPSLANRSKVVFTTRLRKVCGRMGPDDMEVKRLEPEKAWELFRQKVRADTLESDVKIFELARRVCGRCKGLPLALTVIGETMACKMMVHEWQHAVDVLNSNAAGYPEVEEEILKILKFSYDDLKDETVQQCFQYCALFPEDDLIEQQMLVDYWICEGIIDGGGDREKAMNLGYNIIGILVSVSLLMKHESRQAVIMHDVVRHMAQWIASNFGKEEENFVVKTGAGLHQMPVVRDWNAVRRMSLQNNKIRNISVTMDCPNLTTLFLGRNRLVNVSGVSLMPKLVVLDLSGNTRLSQVPEEVSELVSLRFLSLARTLVQDLPMGLRKLIQLRHLDLDFMLRLGSISVISNLLNLETLNIYLSTPLSLESIDALKLLENLQVLSVSITKAFVLERLLSIPKLASCIEGLHLDGFEAINGTVSMEFLAGLHKLEIYECRISDIIVDWGNPTPSEVYFHNLKSVSISSVKGLKDLTWLLSASSLTTLYVGRSSEMKEIISREKAVGILGEKHSIKPFANLKMIRLYNLEKLKSIYWEPLPFPCLTEVSVIKCPNLKVIPFKKESSNRNQISFKHVEEDQIIKDPTFSLALWDLQHFRSSNRHPTL
ncbi:unnamed protein product [Microthlaspi erraticum]|uniref:Uncharacterized protein n=1 Tax=Microthlaspi erraticum TaxID=1685480 RepID=A0A6D2HRS7_9BRAS|nr:unnamed protein product [Microthlaspi erraticum]